jgi:hypothetical protein
VAEILLGPMLRYVSSRAATVWLETDRACTVEILGSQTSTFCVAGHHYALVVVEDLEPGTSTEYRVTLDGRVCWPESQSPLPPSRIRTLRDDQPTARVVFGSCRTAAPHTAPWALELSLDARGRGVDALYTYATQMVDQPAEAWPDLAVFLGDQVYADDSSPQTRARIEQRRNAKPETGESTLPSELVDGFEELTWLYRESWSPPLERWFFSNVASVMIFDDHEMIDDWNISASWVADIRQQSWWEDHVLGGLMTYWLYQHLGNLDPATIRQEGILANLQAADDAHAILHRWAAQSEEFTPVAGGYRFNFVRDIGRVRLVMIDARNGRVLEPGRRRIVDDAEWAWVVEACSAPVDHLLIGSSLPVFVPGGLHDLQVWSESVCDGAWGAVGRRVGEWLRIKADMEDWPAFSASFDAMVDLLADVGGAHRVDAPATISLLSGDIHFSYAAQVTLPAQSSMTSTVHQLVNSPIRNALTGPERTAMRLGASRFARRFGRVLRRAVHRQPARATWSIDAGPVFDNSIGELTFNGRHARLVVRKTRAYDKAAPPAFDDAIDVDLIAGASACGGPPR